MNEWKLIHYRWRGFLYSSLSFSQVDSGVWRMFTTVASRFCMFGPTGGQVDGEKRMAHWQQKGVFYSSIQRLHALSLSLALFFFFFIFFLASFRQIPVTVCMYVCVCVCPHGRSIVNPWGCCRDQLIISGDEPNF